MSLPNDFTQYENLLRVWYKDQRVQDLTNNDNPGIALIGRKEMGGQSTPLPMIDVFGQGVSADLVSARNNRTLATPPKFSLTPYTLYQAPYIDRLTWKSSVGNAASFEDYMKFQIDGGIKNVANMMGKYFYGNGDGILGQISTIVSGVITLADPDSVSIFNVGQVLAETTVSGTGALASANSALGYVVNIDESLGTVTVALTQGGSAATPSGSTGGVWAANGFVGLQGTLSNVAPGLGGFNPLTVTSGQTLFGVDQSINPARRAGSRLPQVGVPLESAFMNGTSLLARMGQKPTVGLTSIKTYNETIKSLQGRKFFIDSKVGGIGFEGVRVDGAKGPLALYGDRNCPDALTYLTDPDFWAIYAVVGTAAPELQTDEFGRLLRDSVNDGYEARVSGYFAFGCNKPVVGCVIQHS